MTFLNKILFILSLSIMPFLWLILFAVSIPVKFRNWIKDERKMMSYDKETKKCLHNRLMGGQRCLEVVIAKKINKNGGK